MSPETLLLYVGTMFLVVLAPGPTVLCIVSQAGRFGFGRSLAGIAEFQVGHLVIFGCVAMGLSTVASAASDLLTVVRVVGAGYLIYLGGPILLSTRKASMEAAERTVRVPGSGSLLLQGLAVQISNPKAILFVSAIVPQFVRADSALLPQVFTLLTVTVIVETAVLAGYAYITARSSHALRSSGWMCWLERLVGATLICLGLRMLFECR